VPELPEVQTIADDLNKKIKGDKIVDFESFWKKSIKGGSFDEFLRGIVGRKIEGARRIGKNLFIDLSGGKTIYIHLKMTGHLLVKPASMKHGTQNMEQKIQNAKQEGYFDEKVNQYIRHVFYLKDQNAKLKTTIQKSKLLNAKYDKTLEFSDLRKFGKIMLVDTEKVMKLPEIAKLGTDVMDEKFTVKLFKEILKKKQKSVIGNVLMDQSLISGIGNIYRSEILFESGVDPKRKVSELKDSEIEEMYKNTLKIIKKAIKLRGTSDSDYRDTSGAPGEMHRFLKVYNREGEKCKKCDTIVKRKKIGQRSIYICSECQK